MAMSMTGYGRGEYLDNKYHFVVEAKSVNNRYLDINVKLPRKIGYLEEYIKQYIKKYISRGKLEIFIKLELGEVSEAKVTYDKELAKGYIDALASMAIEFGLQNQLKSMDLIRFPDVIRLEEKELDQEEIKQSLEVALKEACESLVAMRKEEGNQLKQDILFRCKLLSNNVAVIEGRSEEVEKEHQDRLTQKLYDIMDGMGLKADDQRIVQEAAILADKSNVTEEIVRLKSHISQLEEVMTSENIGRKMDFILQEMNREVNTIGSKSSKIEITNLVVELKSELEKIREQVQNIE